MTKVKMRHPRSGKTMEASAAAYKRVYQPQKWELVETAVEPVDDDPAATNDSETATTGDGEPDDETTVSEDGTSDPDPATSDEGGKPEQDPPELDPDPDPAAAKTAATKAAGGQKGRSSRGGQRKGSAPGAKSEGDQ